MTIGPIGTLAKAAFPTGSGTLSWGGGNSPASGDYVVGVCSSDAVSSLAAGYTKLETSEVFNGAYVFTRLCDGTVTDTPVLSASSGPGVLVFQRFGQVNSSTPLDATSGSHGHSASTSTASSAPAFSVPSAGAGRLIVAVASLAGLAAHDPTGTLSWTNGFTALGEQKSAGTGTTDQFAAMAYKIAATTPETTTLSWTAGAVDNQTSLWLALVPGTAPSPTSFGGGFFA